MKIDFIEVSGFRGFRDLARIELGSGFTVITGRNGVGKSTLCDAIEFAITGAIGKYSVDSAANETVKDYTWWRGEGASAAQYVSVGFSDAVGRPFVLTRTREGGADKTDEAIVAALCEGAVPDNALTQLCKTSILRDEWIAALSLDLKETERFDLVRAALGAVEGGDLAAKAKAVIDAAGAEFRRAEDVYKAIHAQLSGALVERSEASSAAAKSADVAAAMAILDAFVQPTGGEDVGYRLDRARRSAADGRRRLSAIAETIYRGREVEALRHEVDGEAARQKRIALKDARAMALASQLEASDAFDAAERIYAVETKASDVAASLSVLVDHGERLGLDAGHCPLCAAWRTDDEFSRGLAHARARIDALAEGANAAREALAATQRALAVAQDSLDRIDRDWQADAAALAGLAARQEELDRSFDALEMLPAERSDLDALERRSLSERNRLLEVDQALNALEASQAVSRLASVDARVETLRREVDEAAAVMTRAQSALSEAKSLEKSVRRAASEVVDERLALISPLLNELYQRLRPHADWRNIEYSIRGDVRRFLSLKVGNDLNPQFVFSSGQRRAAGLAFLLSVHLARRWAKWTTLILDDPVQHIDDFRALHLVEVLAALRRDGRQIVCAVEDEALADLLCRRLLSTGDQPGRRLRIDIGAKSAATVMEALEIPPMAEHVLRGAVQAAAG